MNAQHYIRSVLGPAAVSYLQQLANTIFQKYNAKLQTAVVTKRFLSEANVTVLPWTASFNDRTCMQKIGSITGSDNEATTLEK